MGLKAAIIPVTPFQQNCSLLWDEDTGKGVVVDPGGDVDRILAAVAETGAAVERILLTHGHIDHAGGAAELPQARLERGAQRAGGPRGACGVMVRRSVASVGRRSARGSRRWRRR